MKRFSIVALVMVGFIAGIAFVYSCGSGGSANAQDMTGVETRLDTISGQISDIQSMIAESSSVDIDYFQGEAVNAGGQSIYGSTLDIIGYRKAKVLFARSDTDFPSQLEATVYFTMNGHTVPGVTFIANTVTTFDLFGDQMRIKVQNSEDGTRNPYMILQLIP